MATASEQWSRRTEKGLLIKSNKCKGLCRPHLKAPEYAPNCILHRNARQYANGLALWGGAMRAWTGGGGGVAHCWAFLNELCIMGRDCKSSAKGLPFELTSLSAQPPRRAALRGVSHCGAAATEAKRSRNQAKRGLTLNPPPPKKRAGNPQVWESVCVCVCRGMSEKLIRQWEQSLLV